MSKIAVVLSGCGVYDGAEIHEAVCTLLALHRAGHEAVCLAPDREQLHVIDHLKGEEMEERRNVLTEAARIARGKISDIAEADPGAVDAVMLPGGFGAAKNLCTFAVEGPDCSVDPGVQNYLTKAKELAKPIAALCIAPALLAKVFGSEVQLTIGNDGDTAAAIEALGAVHVNKPIGEIVVDEANRIVTSPCYMYDATISEIADSAEKVVAVLTEWLS